METQKLALFIGTIVIFFLLIGAALITIMVMPPEEVEENIDLKPHFEDRIEKLKKSIEKIEFVNVEIHITNPDNPIPEINEVLAKNRYVYFPQLKQPILNGKISIPSNTIIKFADHSKLFAVYPSLTPPGDHCLFSMYGVKNITLIGNGVTFYALSNNPVTDDFSTVCIQGSKDIFIEDVNIGNAMRYGLEISGRMTATDTSEPCENIELFNVTVQNSKIGGILISSVNKLKAYKLDIEKTEGKDPENGLTIAPLHHSDLLKDIQIEDLTTKENAGIGLDINPGMYLLEKFTLIIKTYKAIFDGEFAAIYIRESPKEGKITLKNLEIEHKEHNSALIRAWDTRDCEISIFKSKLNGEKEFSYLINDHPDDPIKTNLEKLNIHK